MAANQLRDMYVRIGFSAAAAAAIINPQGIDDLEELENLSDKDVERLCKALKSPGVG